jgi:hypothetical protein
MLRDQVDFDATVASLQSLGRTLNAAQLQELRDTLARTHAPGARPGLHEAEMAAHAVGAEAIDADARERARAALISTVGSRAADAGKSEL